MRFRTWLKQLETVAGTIAPAFGNFVAGQVQLAEQRHGERMAGLVTLGPPPEVGPQESESENRLILLLIRCLPQEWKTSVLEQQDESKSMRALDLLEGVFEVLQPGGAAETQSLNTFVRTLRPVTTAKDGLSVLRRWRLARTRATALALPKLAPFEELQALSTMAQTLERRHDRFRTLLSLLRTDPDIIRPTAAGVDKMVTLIEQQFQLLSADEHIKANRQHEPDPQAAKGKGDGKGKDKGKKGGKETKKPCEFMRKYGKCKFGDRCHYSHDGLQGQASRTTPNPKAAPASTPVKESGTQERLAWAKNGKCKFGDKCKYQHNGEANKAANPKAKPKPKPKAKSTASAAEGESELVGVKPTASDIRVSFSVAKMARSIQGEEESSSQASSSEEFEIPTHAEASTPEWSDVEQGVFPDEDSDVSAEDGDDEPGGGDPLWVLDLTLQDLVAWTRPNHIQTRAERVFREEENPYSVTWGTWITLHHDIEVDDDAGDIPIGEGIVMLQYDWTLVMCIDAVARPCVAAHLMEEDTGRERLVALIRAPYEHMPFVRPWESASLSSAVTRPQRDQPASSTDLRAPVAEAPTVPPPPCMNTQPPAQARAQATEMFHASVLHPPVHGPRLHRTRRRATRDTMSHACAAQGRLNGSERDLVLADSGANEVIRPAQDQPPPRSTQVDLTLADGSAIPSYRSRDGELAVPGSDSWIAPIGKIVELGYRFVWDSMTGAQLIRGEGDGAEIIYMKVENGLPYLEWHDFAILRRQLSQAYGQQKRVLCARAEIKEHQTLQAITMSDLEECEAQAKGAKDCASVQHGENLARKMFEQSKISYDDVLEAIMKADIEPQKKRRTCIEGDDDKVRCWVFGAFAVGPNVGITDRTKDRPWLVRLINKFMHQQLPDVRWSSFTISWDTAFAPRRDLGNAEGSQNALAVLSHKGMCKGGDLWAEHPEGEHIRRVSEKRALRGLLMPAQRNPVLFNPKKWHGTAPWRGTRIALTLFTVRGATSLSGAQQLQLGDIGFIACSKLV